MRIADERRGGDNQEPERQRDVEPYPELPFVIDGGSHVRAGRQRKQQRRELCAAEVRRPGDPVRRSE